MEPHFQMKGMSMEALRARPGFWAVEMQLYPVHRGCQAQPVMKAKFKCRVRWVWQTGDRGKYV